MIQSSLKWQAFSNSDRNETIQRVKDAISSNDGYILNFQMFSDLALSLSIEIAPNKLDSLRTSLGNEMVLSESLDSRPKPSTKECMIHLNLSFGKGTGDLKVEVPAVPG